MDFDARDNKEFYRAENNDPYVFFGSGGASAFGMWQRGAIVERGGKARAIERFDPEAVVQLSQDGFLNQRVLCLKGAWVTRRGVIRYVANTASGVHSGNPKEAEDRICSVIRNAATYTVAANSETGDRSAMISFNLHAAENMNSFFSFLPASIDPVHFELLCATYYMLRSKSVTLLETTIAAELGQAR